MAPAIAEAKSKKKNVEKKVKKKVAKKDGKEKQEKPKRGRSAYILFTMEKRAEFVKENPDLQPKEVLSGLGALWKQTDEKTKLHFKELAEAEKQKLAAEQSA